MLNGDVLTDIDLTAQIAQHERTGARRRSRWSRRGPDGLRARAPARGSLGQEFVEKPSSDSVDTNLISAGAYVLEREILELVPPIATSRSSARCGRR
jgi:mannose-1-phosphate guanylyltransferase